jgi:ligand-binding sensor domain-containing protein
MKFFRSTPLQKVLYAVLAGLASTVIFSSPLFALDPKKRITQYDIRVYKAKDGLPMNDMKDVFQDSKGYLWLACQEGFVRFDGARFVLFDKSNCPGLRENFIYDIEEDWEGNLWLGTNGGGVSRFDGKSCTTFDTSNGLASNIVKRILMGRDRTIWLGTQNGVTRLKNGIYTIYKLGDKTADQAILALHEDRRSNLLVGNEQARTPCHRNDSVFSYQWKAALFILLRTLIR